MRNNSSPTPAPKLMLAARGSAAMPADANVRASKALFARSQFIRTVAIGFAILMIAGCASGSGGDLPTKLAAAPLEKGKARLIFNRSTDLLYFGVSARLDVNGERAAELGRGDSFVANYMPGKIIITTDAWSAPGHYTVTINTEPDTNYHLEITPRGSAMVPGALLGAVGMGLDAAVNENAGPFQIAIKNVGKTATSSPAQKQ